MTWHQCAERLLLPDINSWLLWLYRFIHDILHGVDIIVASIQPALDAASPTAVAGKPASMEQSDDQPLIDVPLRIAVYVTNAGIILPASSK